MTTNKREARALAALLDLGFSEIEARIYAYLLTDSPTTGYRVSHAIGKPTANTYKAIAELSRRGAVQIDEGGNRLVRAVPVEELLKQMERQEGARRQAAAEALKDLEPAGQDDRVYTLSTTQQVLERARAMIARAERTIVADLSPGPFAELRPALEQAAGRKVSVAAKVYEAIEPTAKRPRAARPRLDLVRATDPELVCDVWPGQQLSLVVDAREHVLALLARDLDAVHQAVWSRSTFLSCMHHNQISVEIEFTRLRDRPGRKTEGPTLLLTARPPGLADLQQRYQGPAAAMGVPSTQRRPATGGGR